MRKQSNTLNFEGQNIYVGIDVHLKSWTISTTRHSFSPRVRKPCPLIFTLIFPTETICQPMKPVSVASGHIINWLQWEYRI